MEMEESSFYGGPPPPPPGAGAIAAQILTGILQQSARDQEAARYFTRTKVSLEILILEKMFVGGVGNQVDKFICVGEKYK